jgi:hypothetical protein
VAAIKRQWRDLSRASPPDTPEATYTPEGGRDWLMQQPDFVAAFAKAKEFIRGLEYRYVEEADANRQALLEIYASVVLETPHNDFKNH